MRKNGWPEVATQIRASCVTWRIGRNAAWELIARPKPTDLSEVPADAESLSPQFLSRILCARHPGAAVTGITLSGEEFAGAANHQPFKVTYNAEGTRAGLPNHLFLKSSKYYRQRMAAWLMGLDSNESQFYRVIRPELDIEAPRAYYADFDAASYRSAIVMNDLVASEGAKFLDTSIPLSRADVEGMLAILAEVHAKYWGSERLDREFAWLKSSREWFKILMDGIGFKAQSERGYALLESMLPRSLAGAMPEIWGSFLKSLEITYSQPWTYLNGDAHLRNYYKTASGRIGLADWQVTTKGAWSHDVAYTMLTALSTENRRRWERELLAFYLDRVRSRGGNPPKFSDAWQIYRRQTLYTFVGWLVVSVPGTAGGAQPPAECLEVVNRAAHAVNDLETLTALRD